MDARHRGPSVFNPYGTHHWDFRTFLSLAPALVATACASSQVASPAAEPTATATEPTFTVVSASNIDWGPLNPARGDKGPKAGSLWGDQTGPGPSGFLVRFVDGFASPPHIHNVTYRGVVISGLIHNAHPTAEEMWMARGSFWTQPRGQVHITAAKGSDALAYIEIDEGPYLVRPVEEAFKSEDKPMNVAASNIVWVDASNMSRREPPRMSISANGAKVAFLWGNPEDGSLNGMLVKLPAGSAGVMRGHGSSASTFRAVVITGRVEHREQAKTEVTTMELGSYLSSKGESVHQVSCKAGEECILYVRMEGAFVQLKPTSG